MHRLRSTRQDTFSNHSWPRVVAAASVLVALGAGGFFLTRPSSSTDTTLAVTTPSSPTSTAPAEISDSSTAAISQEVPGGPARGGTVRVGVVGGGGTTFNPYLIGSDRALVPVHHLVAASAFRLDPLSHDLLPGVIEALPTLGNGGLTVNADGSMDVAIRVSPDARWSDGNPIRAADFLRTYEVVMAHRAVIFPDVVAEYDRIAVGSLAVTDDLVSFRLDRTGLDLVGLFDQLLPAHQVPVQTFTTAWNSRSWLSGGPFQRVEASEALIRLEPNLNYQRVDESGGALPYLDAIEVVTFGSIDEAVTALGEGSIDIVGPIEDPALVAAAESLDDVAIDVRRGPGWEQIGIQLGPGALEVNPASVVDRRIIRQAIAGALDRQAIASAVQGPYGVALPSIVGVGWPGADVGAWDTTIDLPGRLTGVTLNLVITGGDAHRVQIADLVTDQLSAAGVDVVLVTDDPGQFFANRILPGQFELAEWAWRSSPGPGAVADDLLSWFTDGGRAELDFSGWTSHPDGTRFRTLVTGLDAVLSPLDLAERLALVEAALAESVPLIPLYADLNVGAANVRVEGFTHSALPGGILAGGAAWWVAGE